MTPAHRYPDRHSARGRRSPARRLLLALASLASCGVLGCWTARPPVVATPEFSSVQVRLDPRAMAELAASRERVAARRAEPPASPTAVARVAPPAAAISPVSTPLAAEDSWKPFAPPRDWRYIVLHHSGTEGGSVEAIDAVHRQRTDERGQPWLGIGYHFVVGNGEEMTDGEIASTFRWHEQLPGAHAGDSAHNARGIGVCVIGDCDAAPPTPLQTAALKRLVATLAERYQISPAAIVPHSDLKATACPGRHFPLEEIVAAATVRESQARTVRADAGWAFLSFIPPRESY